MTPCEQELGESGKEKLPFTGRNLQQSQAQGAATVILLLETRN